MPEISQDAAPRGSRTTPLLHIAALVVLGVVVCAPRLTFFFTHDDFRWLYEGAETLWHPDNALNLILGRFRPVSILYFAAGYGLFGFRSLPFNIAASAAHVLNAVLLYLLTYRLARHRLAALAAATFFLLANAGSQAVAWVAASPDAIATSLFLGVGLLFLASNRERLDGRYWAAVALFAVALLMKENVVSFPLIVLLIDGYWLRERGEKLRVTLRRSIPFFVVVALYLGALWLLDVHAIVGAAVQEQSFREALTSGDIGQLGRWVGRHVVSARLTFDSVGLLVIPPRLRGWHPRHRVWVELALVAVPALLWALRSRLRRPRLVWFALAATTVTFVPLALAGGVSLLESRHLYQPHLFFSLFLAAVLAEACSLVRGRALAAVVFCSLSVWLAFNTWKDQQWWFEGECLAEKEQIVTELKGIVGSLEPRSVVLLAGFPRKYLFVAFRSLATPLLRLCWLTHDRGPSDFIAVYAQATVQAGRAHLWRGPAGTFRTGRVLLNVFPPDIYTEEMPEVAVQLSSEAEARRHWPDRNVHMVLYRDGHVYLRDARR